MAQYQILPLTPSISMLNLTKFCCQKPKNYRTTLIWVERDFFIEKQIFYFLSTVLHKIVVCQTVGEGMGSGYLEQSPNKSCIQSHSGTNSTPLKVQVYRFDRVKHVVVFGNKLSFEFVENFKSQNQGESTGKQMQQQHPNEKENTYRKRNEHYRKLRNNA